MSILDRFQLRCQGRYVNTQFGATMAEECTDCARRTDLEPGQSYGWFKDPPPITWTRYCGSWIPNTADEVVVLDGFV